MFIERNDVVVGSALQDVQISNNGQTGRVLSKTGFRNHLPHNPGATGFAVSKFLLNNLQFTVEFFGIKNDVLHFVRDDVDRLDNVFGRTIDKVCCYIYGRKGVCNAAHAVNHVFRFRFGSSCCRPAGNDVFQNVAQAGAQMSGFVHAAGVFDKTANRRVGRGVVFLNENCQTVGQFRHRQTRLKRFAAENSQRFSGRRRR